MRSGAKVRNVTGSGKPDRAGRPQPR
jgi:hypothetical protein